MCEVVWNVCVICICNQKGIFFQIKIYFLEIMTKMGIFFT